MKTKPLEYYTPDQNEIPYEYEILVPQRDIGAPQKWQPDIFPGVISDVASFRRACELKLIRVKRLDQQDLEELAWVKSRTGSNYYALGENYRLTFSQNNITIKEKKGQGFYIMVNRINIRNKNEMQTLMRQLSINQ